MLGAAGGLNKGRGRHQCHYHRKIKHSHLSFSQTCKKWRRWQGKEWGEGSDFVVRDIVTIVERAIHAGCSREIALGKRPSPMPLLQKGNTVRLSVQTCKRFGGGGGIFDQGYSDHCREGYSCWVQQEDWIREEAVTSATITERLNTVTCRSLRHVRSGEDGRGRSEGGEKGKTLWSGL